jgi:hypothetical protein
MNATEKGELIKQYLRDYPALPSQRIARIICEKFPEYGTQESIRTMVRRYRGVQGKSSRNSSVNDEFIYNPTDLPLPYTYDSTPFVIKEKSALVLPDLHFPVQDNRAIDTAINWTLKYEKPECIVLNGDVIDCVIPETKILTYDLRWIPAGSLNVGDRIIGFDENSPWKDVANRRVSRKLRSSIVESCEVAKQEIIALHMDDGTVLRCSPGHRWLGRRNRRTMAVDWMRADEIYEKVNAGKSISISKVVDPWTVERDYDSGYIAGAFDGEGSLTFHKCANNFGHITFAQRMNSFMKKVIDAVKRKGFDIYLGKSNSSDCMSLVILRGMWAFAEFIGRFDIPRFREKWVERAPIDGYSLATHLRTVVRAEKQGYGDVVVLQTSTKTYIAEGFCSHNCYQLSRFLKNPNRAGVEEEIEDVRDFLQVLQDAFKLKIYYKFSNHERRFENYIYTHAGELVNIKELALEYLLKLKEYNCVPIKDKRIIKLGKLNIIHGDELQRGMTAPVNPARGLFLKCKATTLGSHSHITSEHSGRTINRELITCWSTGCLCYSDDTDILTDFGFKNFKDVNLGDKIANYNPQTSEITLSHPLAIQHLPYSGDMIHIKNDRIDALTTPEHKFLVMRHDRAIKSMSATEIHYRNKENKIPISGYFVNKDYDTVKASLIGWIIGEGTLDNSNSYPRISIYQTKQVGLNEIFDLIGKLDLKYSVSKDKRNGNQRIRFSTQDSRIILSWFDGGDIKSIPRELLNSNKSSLMSLYESLISSDGSRKKNGTDYFATIYIGLATQFSELCCKIGYSNRIKQCLTPPNKLTKGGSYYRCLVRKFQYREIGTTTIIPYSGVVHDVTSNTGWIIVRRNNSIFISSNCDLQPEWNTINEWNHGFAYISRQDSYFRVINLRIENGIVY